MVAQCREILPRLTAVVRSEERRVLDARVHDVGIVQRRLEMPDAHELPRALRAVIPEMRAGRAVVRELVADGFPRLAAVVRALDELPEPRARLRRVEAIRIGGRSLDVIKLPAREVRPVDVPVLARSVGRQNERALACADQNSDGAHSSLPFIAVAVTTG